MPEFHIAQINIARMLAPIDAIADQSPGFVWRLQAERGDATSIKVYDDDMIIVNLTVWENLDGLRAYIYKSAHHGVLRDRKRWFVKFEGPYYALWRVPAGHLPDVEEGKARLDHLRQHGESAYAFSFKYEKISLSLCCPWLKGFRKISNKKKSAENEQ